MSSNTTNNDEEMQPVQGRAPTANQQPEPPPQQQQQQPRTDPIAADPAEVLAAEIARQQPLPQQNQFGAVRDRLFHAMLVRVAVSYNRHVPLLGKRFIEFSCLLMAMVFLAVMIYVHHFFDKTDSNCLAAFADKWPRDGVLRVEVISNLEKFNTYQDRLLEESYERQNGRSNITVYDLRRVLMEGPSALPKELRSRPSQNRKTTEHHWTDFLTSEGTLFSLFVKSDSSSKKKQSFDELDYDEFDMEAQSLIDDSDASFEYVVEYSLHYGLLKLSHSYRLEHHIPFLLVRLDPEIDSCFGDWLSRTLMKYFIGYEDVLMTSIKALAENETDKGYLRDMITGEHYRFVTMGNPRASYFTALVVMLIFTFAISMLLRFSHHQIFLFIVDLLQMFEFNQALVFPAAPLLTVILALVGMEAIMSEVFNDTSTAFYVILLVWIADQYDAICCHSVISKRHWLRLLKFPETLLPILYKTRMRLSHSHSDAMMRYLDRGLQEAAHPRSALDFHPRSQKMKFLFFYLYHYAFYAYQYRYNGQYGGLALLTSTFFILHSMIFCFHHYEMPLIVYQDRLQRIITDLQHSPPQQQGEIMNDTAPGDTPTTPAAAPPAAAATPIVTRTITFAVPRDRADQPAGETSSSSIVGISRNDELSPPTVLESPESSSSGTGTGERGNTIASTLGEMVALNDPLLAAGERTAREIVDSAMNGIFSSTATTTVSESGSL